jgi:hypothetical protein
MKILDRNELDEQRRNYLSYISNLNKIAAGVGDGTIKGDAVRDMLLILQARFLTFVLSELVHMSQMLWEMENQSNKDSDNASKTQIIDDDQDEEKVSGSGELEDVSTAERDYERGSTDLLGRFKGLGLLPDEESTIEHLSQDGSDDPALPESEKKLGGTAKLIAALADIESAGTTEEAQKIVDDIYKLTEELEDDEE